MRGDLSHGFWAVCCGGLAYFMATTGTGFGIALAAVFGFLALVQVGMLRDG